MSTAIAEVLTVSEEDYHADKFDGPPSLSSSLCKILCDQTPWHAWTAHPRLNPNFIREEKEIFDLGTVAHALMLQGLKNAIVLDIPDWRTAEARKTRSEARAEGKIAILRKHWSRVQDMVAAGNLQLSKHREAADAFSDGKPEQTLVWTDDHGVRCRARLDWLKDSRKGFADYKSTGMTANPEAISRSMFGSGWDVQESFYRRGLKKLGFDAVGLFVCQEDSPPYALSVIGFDPLIQRVADNKVQAAIDLWANCLASNKWPGYPDRICYPEMPGWMADREMERELKNVVHPSSR